MLSRRHRHPLIIAILALSACATVAPAVPDGTAGRPVVRENVPACIAQASEQDFRLDFPSKMAGQAKVPSWMHGQIPQKEMYGHGSGVVISEDGLILTNAHVVMDNHEVTKLTVTMDIAGAPEPVTTALTIVAVDESMDLALVRVDRTFRSVAIIAEPGEAVPGMAIYNVGFPYDFGESVGRGAIKRLHYKDPGGPASFQDIILADISDGSGTSGSAVYSEATGKVVGLMMAYSARVDGHDSPKWVVRFIIPVERIRAFLDANHVHYHTSPRGTLACDPR
ncbi:MAG: hypothetical protein RLZZ324_815 [Candidatus Parcubacteria bacterium]|jgi:S1-C subfamily serine protease